MGYRLNNCRLPRTAQLGQGVVEKLALDLTAEFNGAEGFSVQNLWRMRLLYLAYKDSSKLAQLVREIPWGQNIVIMQMVKDPPKGNIAGVLFGYSFPRGALTMLGCAGKKKRSA